MTHKLIKTDNYLLVVDDSLTIGKGYALNTSYKLLLKYDTEQHLAYDNDVIKKIIAHLPLNGFPILEGVDLLPPYSRHQEDGLDNAVMEFKERYGSLGVTDYELSAFSKGYNKAREKFLYTEHDLQKAFTHCAKYAAKCVASGEATDFYQELLSYLESISQYPTEFECKMTSVDDFPTDTPHHKTTTNAQGQRVWVGKYK